MIIAQLQLENFNNCFFIIKAASNWKQDRTWQGVSRCSHSWLWLTSCLSCCIIVHIMPCWLIHCAFLVNKCFILGLVWAMVLFMPCSCFASSFSVCGSLQIPLFLMKIGIKTVLVVISLNYADMRHKWLVVLFDWII